MATLTPQEEYDKQQKKLTRELELQTSSLRTPFRQLITSISETNSELGKIASDNIGKTQDTWTGLITQGKKQRMINKVEKSKEYKEQAAAVKAQKESQAALETQKFNLERESQINRQEAIDGDEHLNKFVRTRKAKLEKQYLTASKGEREKINKELGKVTATITERETFLAKEIDTKKEEESKRLDKQIKLGQDGVRESSIYIDETNEQLEHDLEKVSKSENFDKFQSSIKTLSFGIIDIAGVLDPISKQIGALKDLGSAIGGVTKKVTGGFKKFGNFLTKGRKESIESGKEVAEKTIGLGKSIASNEKKGAKGLKGLMRSMSMGVLVIGALILAVYLLRKKFKGFADWLDNLMNKKTPQQRDNLVSAQDKLRDDLAAAKGDTGKQAEIFAAYKAEEARLIALQEQAVKEQKVIDAVNAVSDVPAASIGAFSGNRLRKVVEPWTNRIASTAWNNPVTELTAEDLIKRDNLKVNKDGSINKTTKLGKQAVAELADKPGFWKKLGRSAGAMVKNPGRMLKGNAVMALAGAGLTLNEIRTQLNDSKTAEEKIDLLANTKDKNGNRWITEEEEKEARTYLEQKRKQDKGMPIWMSVVGGVGALAIGTALGFTGIGTAPGIALAAVGGTMIAGATGIGMDMANQGDENLYALLESKGIHIDPKKVDENLKHMESIQLQNVEDAGQTAEKLTTGQQDLDDAKQDQKQGGGAIVSTVLKEGDNNNSILLGQHFDARDRNPEFQLGIQNG